MGVGRLVFPPPAFEPRPVYPPEAVEEQHKGESGVLRERRPERLHRLAEGSRHRDNSQEPEHEQYCINLVRSGAERSFII